MARYTLGIYWDNVFIRACLIKTGISEFAIERIVSDERTSGAAHEPGKGIDHEIKSLMLNFGTAVDTCVTSLSEHEIMYRPLLRPFGDRNKIADTIGSEVETLLPVLDSSVIVDHVLLGRDDAGLYRVETVSARHTSVAQLIKELKSADLDPEIIDSPSIALVGGARNIFELAGDKSYLFLYMGWKDTSLAVLEGSELRYVGAFPYGFEKIASLLEQGGSDPLANITGTLSEGVMASAALDTYIREILISLHRIGSGIDKTVLVPLGYAHYIKDLPSRFEEAGDIPTEIPPLKEMQCECSLDDILVNFLPVSLACRGFDNTDAINFRQDDLSSTRRMEWIKGNAGVWAKVGLVLALLWFFALGLDVYLKARVDGELSGKIKQEFAASMPKGTPMVDSVKQMEQHLSRLSGQTGGLAGLGKDSPLEILRDISVSIPGGIDVVFDNITID
ncbi:MAG: hypothetical protein E4H15_03980, partial [Syntrophobacterales bacterium]